MQNAIVIMVDVEAVLADRNTDDNVWLIDNTRSFGSESEGQECLVSTMVGVLGPDGSQAAEAVLNWVAYGISDLPPTLPRNFHAARAALDETAQLVADVRGAKGAAALSRVLTDHEARAAHKRPRMVVAGRHPESAERALLFPPLGPTGDLLSRPDLERAGHLTPLIASINGPAVEAGVIYPAQYGSPDLYTEGWYWSASIDVSKVGLHEYGIELLLHRPEPGEGGAIVWVPEIYALKAHLRVKTGVTVNGFTGWGPGLLPIWPAQPALAAIEEGSAA